MVYGILRPIPERTLHTLEASGFFGAFGDMPLSERVTHPANHGYPAATFDYLLGRKAKAAKPIITRTPVSDHFPFNCDFNVP